MKTNIRSILQSFDLCIFRVDILFKKFRSFVDRVVCQVDEHVVDILIRGGVELCCKPERRIHFKSEGTRSLGTIQPNSFPDYSKLSPCESLVIKIDPEWINAGNKNIHSEVELDSLYQQRVHDVLLHT